jgi:NAD(P)-dependent dehydrogenase (short-subunit alcohol dehydrogenase family)
MEYIRPRVITATCAVACALLVLGLRRAHFRATAGRALALSTIVIAGASQGIGAALARRLAKAYPHARLVLSARSASLLAKLAQELQVGRPGEVLSRPCDFSDGEAVRGLAREVERCAGNGGGADVVVCCAGVGSWRAIYEHDASPEHVAAALGAPLAATLHAAAAFLPGQLARERGRFVMVQSPASRAPWPGATAYAASRWGLRGVAAALAVDLAASGRRGVTATECVLTEVESSYFSNNPGSHERLPGIAPYFGKLSVEDAAACVEDALLCGDRVAVYPLLLRWGLASLWVPGIGAAFEWLLVKSGWAWSGMLAV